MKKIIALATLVAAGSSLAATTSSTKVSVSDMSFSERVGVWYWGETGVKKLNRKNGDEVQKADSLNYVNASFKVTDKITTNLTLRMNLSDANDADEMGVADKYEELDTRIGMDYKLFDTGMFSSKVRGVFELPTSQSSINKEKITRAKAYMYLTTKFDDYNKLTAIVNYNKDFYNKAQKANAETSKYYMTQYFSYTNTALSEKIVPRIDIEMLQSHMAGGADNQLAASSGDERILIGTDIDVAGTSVYPFVSHDPSRVKAANQAGMGVQIFKAF
jgi:hypothetical protein